MIDEGIAEASAFFEAAQYTEAERKYVDTKILLERAEASLQAEPVARRLLWIEFAWLLLLLILGYLTHKYPRYWLWEGFLTWHAGAAWFGGLGGVTVGIFGLYSHIQARDFDSKYELWYICKPITGAIFGWFVVAVFVVGLVTVQQTSGPTNPILLYVIAFLAGFSERFTIRIVDQVMQVLTTWKSASSSTPGSPRPGK